MSPLKRQTMPPEAHRFTKGKSGNPTGRPKRPMETQDILRDILDGKVTLRDGDQQRTAATSEALLRMLVAKAMRGDVRANRMIDEFRTRAKLTASDLRQAEDVSRANLEARMKRLCPESWDYFTRPSDEASRISEKG